MHYYCDTSILAAVYLTDSHSTKVAAWLQKEVLPLPLTPLLELELTSAIEQRLFRKQMTANEVVKSRYFFQLNLEQGVYQRVTLHHDEEYQQAMQLIRRHTAVIGCRTLDVLHVAAALQLRLRTFVTTDSRQKLLAETVGLKVLTF